MAQIAKDMTYFQGECPDNIELLKFTRKSDKKSYLTAKCLVCDNKWESRSGRVVYRGCPTCSSARIGSNSRKTPAEFKKQMKEVNPEITVVTPYVSAFTHITARHTCGHEWQVTPANLQKGRGCPACKNSLKLSTVLGEYVRGYEPQAIELIVKSKLAKARDLQVTAIPYVKYRFKGGWHRYHPDILIKRQNRVVEVKSVATLGIKHNGTFFKGNAQSLFAKTKAKRLGCIAEGFKFSLLLMNEDGTRIALPRDWHKLTLLQLRASMTSRGR